MHVALNLQRMATTTTSWKIIVTVNVTMPSAFSMYLHDTMRSEMHKILPVFAYLSTLALLFAFKVRLTVCKLFFSSDRDA